ncbi:hypothetical protein F2Q68_00041048 [Brassica cretica]|uniref:Uncharacterized protein n=1 Tax=Brassica cretica TaxID=69181 RepID=A0A8S9ME20_BRACR|nr:hypothetical protein F2Q68_00041048 [Brassica cretica]
MAENVNFTVTFVYGFNTIEERIALWEELVYIHDSTLARSSPWTVLGDFNQIIRLSHHSGYLSSIIDPSSIDDLVGTMQDAELFECQAKGLPFTWWNNNDSDPISKRIDHALVNLDWSTAFPDSFADFLQPDQSDHAPFQERLKNVKEQSLVKTLETEIETTHDQNRDEEKLEKQLQAWRNNPHGLINLLRFRYDQRPKNFSKHKKVNVELSPESVYNIFTHPDNKRYFKNIKEYISRNVLKEEGPMQTVEVKQAAAWKFLWWAGTFPKMGVFPGFGSWISKNSQQPLKAKSKGFENVESKLVSEKDTNSNAPANNKKNRKEHYDEKEERIQHILWHEEKIIIIKIKIKKKVKVTTKKGVYHMNLEMTIGAAPELTYLWLIDSWGSHFYDEKKRRDLMVLTEDGPRRVIKVEKAVVYDFFSLTSIPIPLHLIVEENEKDLTEKVMLMKVFEGNYKLEPVYVDQERLCKKRLPKSQEEYKNCSGGQGKIATKLIINQYFEPYPPFNLPPLSWYIRGNTIKTSKNLLNALQDTAKIIRSTKG